MFRLAKLLCFAFIALLFSCRNEEKYTYAIKDFRKPLQPYLTKIVSTGIVMYYDSSLDNMASDKELLQLTLSEHPILRASAFREIKRRKLFIYFDELMKHLDDTANVQTDAGEFGIWSRTVSDDILEQAIWKTQNEKNKTIEQVLTKHNYLQSAYVILPEIGKQEKYYKYIKDMATRPRRLTEHGYELDFRAIEYALYALARFEKKEDIPIIKSQLLEHASQLSDLSFGLMQEYPDTAYFDVLQSYHRTRFYRFSGNRRGGFSGYIANKADPEDFIQALILQKSDNSARLLDTVLKRLPLHKYISEKNNFIENVIVEIWKHPCPAYAALRERIKSKALEAMKGEIEFELEPRDTSKQEIRWK